jgi:hypothetical protein
MVCFDRLIAKKMDMKPVGYEVGDPSRRKVSAQSKCNEKTGR